VVVKGVHVTPFIHNGGCLLSWRLWGCKLRFWLQQTDLWFLSLYRRHERSLLLLDLLLLDLLVQEEFERRKGVFGRRTSRRLGLGSIGR
jgi:hypothetical protein